MATRLTATFAAAACLLLAEAADDAPGPSPAPPHSAEGNTPPPRQPGGAQPTLTSDEPGSGMKTIPELAGGWQNLGIGFGVALAVIMLIQWLFSWREASLDASHAANEAARLAKVDQYRQKEIAKMREARLEREAKQAVLKAQRDEEKAAAAAEGAATRSAKKKAAENEMKRRRAELGEHVLASMATAASDNMVDGRVTAAASPPSKAAVASAAVTTIAKIKQLKSGQLKAVLKSLELDAKGSTAELQKRLLQAAASSGTTAAAISRHPSINTALQASPAAVAKRSPAKPKSLVSAKASGKFPATNVVVHWTGRERKETIQVGPSETVGGLKAKIAGNIIFANPAPIYQKLVYAGRVLGDDSETLLGARISDGSAVHLVVAAAPAPAPRPSASRSAASSSGGVLGYLESSGAALLRKDGSRVAASSLEGKVVALYFSAHWCPPCRGFTPKLKEFYEEVNASGHVFEVIFVSSDRSAQEMASYITESHGDWVSLDFAARDVRLSPLLSTNPKRSLSLMDMVCLQVKESLSKTNGVRGIPMLCVHTQSLSNNDLWRCI